MSKTNSYPNVLAKRQNQITKQNSNGPMEWTCYPLEEEGKIITFDGDGFAIEISRAVFRCVATNLRFTGHEELDGNTIFTDKDLVFGHELTEEGLHIIPFKFRDTDVYHQTAIGYVHCDYNGLIDGQKVRKPSNPSTWLVLNKMNEDYYLANLGNDRQSMLDKAANDAYDMVLRGDGIAVNVAPFRPYFEVIFETLSQKTTKVAIQMFADGKQRSRDRQKLNTTKNKAYDSKTKSWDTNVAEGMNASIEVMLEGEGLTAIRDLDHGSYGVFNQQGHRVRVVRVNNEMNTFDFSTLNDAKNAGFTIRQISSDTKKTI